MNRLTQETAARRIFWDYKGHIDQLAAIEGVISRLLVAQPTGEKLAEVNYDTLLKAGIDIEQPAPMADPFSTRHLHLVVEPSAIEDPIPLAEVVMLPSYTNQ